MSDLAKYSLHNMSAGAGFPKPHQAPSPLNYQPNTPISSGLMARPSAKQNHGSNYYNSDLAQYSLNYKSSSVGSSGHYQVSSPLNYQANTLVPHLPPISSGLTAGSSYFQKSKEELIAPAILQSQSNNQNFHVENQNKHKLETESVAEQPKKRKLLDMHKDWVLEVKKQHPDISVSNLRELIKKYKGLDVTDRMVLHFFKRHETSWKKPPYLRRMYHQHVKVGIDYKPN